MIIKKFASLKEKVKNKTLEKKSFVGVLTNLMYGMSVFLKSVSFFILNEEARAIRLPEVLAYSIRSCVWSNILAHHTYRAIR